MEIKKIRCKICNLLKNGIILNHYNIKLCLECFPQFFEKRVSYTIEKFKMFNNSNDLLVAVSGGKDSMSLAKVLKNLRYKIRALHINMGFGDISEETEEHVRKFCFQEEIQLKTIRFNEFFDTTLPAIAKISKRPICALCGMIRRYIINVESKNETIVTGHTLNDETAYIFKNMLFWNDELLSRIYPILREKESLSRKAKPLCLITEEETKIFCEIVGIEYVRKSCPYKSEIYEVFKGIVNELNKTFPGSIIGFYKGYLKRVEKFYPYSQESTIINQCERCNYPTISNVCSLCRLKEKLVKYKDG